MALYNPVMGTLFAGASALNAFSVAAGISAHNLANISTGGFSPLSAKFADLSRSSGALSRTADKTDVQTETPILQERHSKTMPEQEMFSLINYQRSFQANVQTVRTADAILGAVLNIIA